MNICGMMTEQNNFTLPAFHNLGFLIKSKNDQKY